MVRVCNCRSAPERHRQSQSQHHCGYRPASQARALSSRGFFQHIRRSAPSSGHAKLQSSPSQFLSMIASAHHIKKNPPQPSRMQASATGSSLYRPPFAPNLNPLCTCTTFCRSGKSKPLMEPSPRRASVQSRTGDPRHLGYLWHPPAISSCPRSFPVRSCALYRRARARPAAAARRSGRCL